MAINIGALRHRVTILAPPDPEQVDELGQPSQEWTVVGERWAEVRDLTGRSLWAAQQVHQEIRTEVRMRWTPIVKAGMRIRHGDRLLEIVGLPADPDGRRRELVLQCREVAP